MDVAEFRSMISSLLKLSETDAVATAAVLDSNGLCIENIFYSKDFAPILLDLSEADAVAT